MDMTIDQQVALDEALVPHTSRLRIRKRNFRLRSDITSKESTLQLVYDVLRLTPFYKAFLVTTDVPEIYMQEFWATATVHHHSIHFKMDNRKRIVNLEYFMEMMHICPRLPGQTFDDLPFEEEILAFLRFLRHRGEIRKLTNEDFIYQVDHKDAKKSNKMYYPRFTKVIIHYFMTKDPSIPRRNKNTQQFGVMLPIELTNEAIRNSKAYKEYYVVASGTAPPKTKVSVRKTKSSSNTTINPPTTTGTRLSTFVKGKQPAKASKAKSLTVLSELTIYKEEETKDEESFDPIVQTPKNSDDEGNDDANLGLNVGSEEGQDAEDDEDELYRDVNINLEGIDVQMTDVHTTKEFEDTHVTLTPFAGAISSIPGIVQRYMDQRMNKAVKNLDENIQKIIKEQVKEQVKVQVSKILPKIEKTVNKKLEAEVLTLSSKSSKTSYAVTADLSEMELKKILIEKIERNKDIVTLKRRCDDDVDKDEKLSAGSDRGSKRRREGNKRESISALKEKATRTTGKSTQGSKSQQKTANESTPAKEPMQTTQDLEDPSHQEFETATHGSIQPWISDLAKQADSRSSFNELMDTTVDFSAFLMNRLKVDTLTSELLARPTYELMKGSCKSFVELEFFLEEPLPLIPNSRGRRVIPFDHFINNDLEYLRGGASSRKHTTFVTKTKAADYGHIKWIEDLVPRTMGVKNCQQGVCSRCLSKCRIITVTELQIVKWHNYKHLDWITLGVKSYQKKLNLTKPDMYRFDLKRKESYISYSNPRGFIYQNKDKQNRLMRIDELHKFSDGTLNDVRTAMDECLKGIWMKYLPQAIWKKSDKERAVVMIQAIDKQLKTRRIMRSLEKFVGGRLYEGDFRMLQRTI
nr:hypothetical protein [Tanacetum cinerariifolium]